MLIKRQTIPWKPLTLKHAQYISRAIHSRISIAEGAVRSGKTIDHCMIAAIHLETCPDRLHLASGSSIRNAKLNIGDCNGFGLEHLFRGRCRWGKYKNNEALIIQTQTGEKVVVYAGGGKADSYKSILGNSYGLWLATEINEHYLNFDDPKISFVHVAFGRQIAAQMPMTLWDLNPSNPEHRIYKDFIDKYRDEGTANYQHFTLHDNGSLTPERIAEVESRYIPGTIWHTRDILGKRCVAEGLIYQTFANNPKVYSVNKPDYDYIQIGVDFGGSKSAFAFVASGLKRDHSKLTALASERHPAKGIDPDAMYRLLFAFIDKVQHKYGKVKCIYADSAEQTLINGIRSRIQAGSNIAVINSVKNPIVNRIKTALGLIALKQFYYTDDCETLVKALSGAVYDPKKFDDERLDNGTSDIDTIDAFEYSWESAIRAYSRSK